MSTLAIHSYATCLNTHMVHDSSIWDMTHSCETERIHMGHDSFIWTCLSKYVVHDSFTWDMTLDIFRATRFFDIVSFLFCVVLPCVCDVKVCSTHRGDFIFLNVCISNDTDINTFLSRPHPTWALSNFTGILEWNCWKQPWELQKEPLSLSHSFLTSVLQCVAVCCSVLQCVAVCYSVLRCVAVCCSVLQCIFVAPFFSVSGHVSFFRKPEVYAVFLPCVWTTSTRVNASCVAVCCSALQSAAVCCSVLQRVAVCERQVTRVNVSCVAVCSSVWQSDAVRRGEFRCSRSPLLGSLTSHGARAHFFMDYKKKTSFAPYDYDTVYIFFRNRWGMSHMRESWPIWMSHVALTIVWIRLFILCACVCAKSHLQCVTFCCSVLQCVAVCCSVCTCVRA